MRKLTDTLRTPGGMVAILGVVCVLVGPTISTIAGSNGTLAAVGARSSRPAMCSSRSAW